MKNEAYCKKVNKTPLMPLTFCILGPPSEFQNMENKL